MPRRRILHEVRLDKIAGVTMPCQEHAQAHIIKARSYTENERKDMAEKKQAMPDGSVPIANVADLRAAVKQHADTKDKKVKAHIKRRAKALGAMTELPESLADPDQASMGGTDSVIAKACADLVKLDMPQAQGFAEVLAANEEQEKRWSAETAMWPLFDALRQSLSSIAADADIAPADRVTMAEQSVTEFVAALKTEWPDVAEAVNEIAKASPNATAMAAFIKAGASGDEEKTMTTMKIEDHPDYKAHMANAKADGMKACAAEWMDDKGEPTKKARELVAKAAPQDDELLKSGDVTIKKSVVGADTFAILKAQQEQITKANDLRIDAEMSKRAQTEFPDLVGTDVEKGAILRHLSGAPEDVRKAAEAILTSAQAMAKGSFETRGTTGAGTGAAGVAMAKAKEDFMAKVSEVQTRDKISKSKAMEVAEKEHPALFKAYQGGE